MPPSLAFAGLLLLTLWGAALASAPMQWSALVVGVALGWHRLVRCQRWHGSVACCLLVLLLCSGLRAGLAAQPKPGPLDPLHHIPDGGVVQVLEGIWQRDTRPQQGRCRGRVRVDRVDGVTVQGESEVWLESCAKPLPAGALIRAEGRLRRPARANHPLLSSPAERLARQGCWTQFQASDLRVIGQRWTPLADARRRVQVRFDAALGPDQGPMLAALVLGGAQVELTQSLRQSFRVAGLSHALAASGFHLSVLLGGVLLFTRDGPSSVRVLLGGSAMVLFLALAGGQASVVRAVVMGVAALVIREQGARSRPVGVLLATLVLMLWLKPGWAEDIGFQFSAAATAGLVVMAPPLEKGLQSRLPRCCRGLAAALAVPMAAMAWTLPLQWWHFGAMPAYALIANLLASPLLSLLTLMAMGLAVLALLLPQGWFSLVSPWLAFPAKLLALVLQQLVTWISSWPFAQVFTGRPQLWTVLVLVGAIVACCTAIGRRWGFPWLQLPLALLALILHGAGLMTDAVVRVEQWGRQWVLLRHQGRAALIAKAGDRLSCRVAHRLGKGYGHARFDWVAVLDPVATDQQACWQAITPALVAEQLGQPPLRLGQRLASPGLVLTPTDRTGRRFQIQAGDQRLRMERKNLNLSS